MSENKLKRDISSSAVLVTSAGGMIGCGWLFSSFYSAQIAGVGSLIAWVIAAVFMFFIALPLCELGAVYPISGGLSNYPKFTHGEQIGFIFSVLVWLSYVVMTPIEVQAVLQYASVYYPPLIYKNAGAAELTGVGYFIAVTLMILLVFANHFGIKFISESNKVISIFKFFVPLFVVYMFIHHAPNVHNLSLLHISSAQSWHNIFSALSLGGIAFAFTGFQNGLVLAGEVKNPQRNIPLSILGAVFIGFIIYFLLQLAFIIALPAQKIQDGFSALSFEGDAGPLVGLSILIGLGFLAKLLMLDSVISPLGTSFVYTTATSRILYGMAENGFLPKFFLKLNKNKIPYLTLLVNFFVGILVFFPFPTWQKMVAFLSSTSILSYSVGSICLLALRIQRPDIPRPFRLPFPILISTISFFVCNLLLYWCGWDIISKLYFAVILGFSIAYFCTEKNVKHSLFKTSGWFFIYMTCLSVISYCGTYRGASIIAFPVDYIALFILSIVFLKWSTVVASKSYFKRPPDRVV